MIPMRHIPWIPALAVALLTCHYSTKDAEAPSTTSTTMITSASAEQPNSNADVLPKSAFAPAAPRTISNTAARAQLIEARCAREARCDNIGSRIIKPYASTEQCVTKLHTDMNARGELGDRECPVGVLPAQLDHCLDAITAEDCSTNLRSIDNFVACRTRELCLTATSTGRPF